jgi:hypothetical protein
MGNRGEPGFATPLARALRDDRDALVRGHAAWALGKIASLLVAADPAREEWEEALTRAVGADDEAWVREEARLALAEVAGR